MPNLNLNELIRYLATGAMSLVLAAMIWSAKIGELRQLLGEAASLAFVFIAGVVVHVIYRELIYNHAIVFLQDWLRYWQRSFWDQYSSTQCGKSCPKFSALVSWLCGGAGETRSYRQFLQELLADRKCTKTQARLIWSALRDHSIPDSNKSGLLAWGATIHLLYTFGLEGVAVGLLGFCRTSLVPATALIGAGLTAFLAGWLGDRTQDSFELMQLNKILQEKGVGILDGYLPKPKTVVENAPD